MPNKKIKMSHNNNKKKRNRYIFIGNYKNNNNDTNDNDNDDDDILRFQCEINLLSSRLKLIEDALSSSVIIKAKPIMSVIMGDTNCMNKFNKIYENWINYTSSIANSLEINYNVNDLFWQLDTFIFHNYFYNLKNNEKYIFEFVNVVNLKEYTTQQLDILNMAFFKDRNEHYKLFYPHHKEYISTLIMNNNRIFLIYFEKELYLISNTNTNNNNNNKNDYQFSDGKLHPALSLNNSVIGNTDLDIIELEKGDKNDVLNFPTVRDKRQIIIKNTKPLYNTLVDLVTLNKLNSSLYKFNPLLFNLSLIIFHAMLHIKRDITANNNNNYDPSFPHDNLFLKEYINYTPSVLYGHPMIPPLTLSSYN